MKLDVTARQMQFIRADCDEVLFGGAAGGGKSFGQLADSLIYAATYPTSKQLILRRTFPELVRSLVMQSLLMFPQSMATYYRTAHIWRFKNGSSVEFGYCNLESDVTKYQSAEYDVIRFDELTHFTFFQYAYLISRNRGANCFPKSIKSTTNPGGIGHSWVKKRFIDLAPPLQITKNDQGRKILFIPALVQDNPFLMKKDPKYINRLAVLPENERKALLHGQWDIFEGQFFDSFARSIHVIKPFAIPKHWRRYVSLDYGLDMLACYWAAFDEMGRGYVYRELYEPNLIVSKAAEKILAMTPKDEQIYLFFAPPDLWGRGADTGKSIAEIFLDHGVSLSKVSAAREAGWLGVKEWLEPFLDERGELIARLRIFEHCVNLIRTLPALVYAKHSPNDVAAAPHELTHAPDAIRYLIAGRPMSGFVEEKGEDDAWFEELLKM